MIKKRGVVLLSLVIFGLIVFSTLVSAQESGGITKIFSNAFDAIVKIGSLQFLNIQGQSVVMGFLRVMVGILVFALFFEGTRLLPFGRNSRVVIALVLAVLSVILIPGQVLVGISAAYSTLAALILIGVPVAGAFYLVYRIPSTNAGEIGVKLILLFITLWALWILRAWISTGANAPLFGFGA